jgi:hypothetical protein
MRHKADRSALELMWAMINEPIPISKRTDMDICRSQRSALSHWYRKAHNIFNKRSQIMMHKSKRLVTWGRIGDRHVKLFPSVVGEVMPMSRTICYFISFLWCEIREASDAYVWDYVLFYFFSMMWNKRSNNPAMVRRRCVLGAWFTSKLGVGWWLNSWYSWCAQIC